MLKQQTTKKKKKKLSTAVIESRPSAHYPNELVSIFQNYWLTNNTVNSSPNLFLPTPLAPQGTIECFFLLS